MKIRIKDLAGPSVYRRFQDESRRADISLINLNLMLVNNDGTFDQQAYMPLGLLYLAAVIRRAGYNSEFIDYQLYSHAREFDAARFARDAEPQGDLIGISCMSNMLPFAILVAEEIHRQWPHKRIILGGVGPSPVAAGIVEKFDFIDHVVIGEGEIAILNLLEAYEQQTSREIIGRVVQGIPPAKLDDLPLPDYDLIDFVAYDAAPSLITSRGCPFQCTFCTEPINFSGRVRFRSNDSVLREMEEIYQRSGRTMYLFQDDILPMKKSRFREMLRGFGSLSFEPEWKCFSRVDLMDDELMTSMASAGCCQIRYGIESGSNTTLKTLKKGFAIELAYEVAKRSVEIFESVHASFIWGYPFEQVEEFRETLYWVRKFEEAGVSVLLFEYSPLPGSPLYKQFREGLEFSPDFYSFYVLGGHEIVKSGSYDTRDSTGEAISELIKSSPNIFSGFYHYASHTKMRLAEELSSFNSTRRSAVRNERDL